MAVEALKPKDIPILLQVLVTSKETKVTYENIGKALKVSSSQAYYALKRCENSHLYDSTGKRVRRRELAEFVSHGVRYAFPGHAGEVTRGIPTAFSNEFLRDQFVGSENGPQYVWPTAEGQLRGESIEPLYPRLLEVVEVDSLYHELLSLIDVIRVGSARERNVASTLFREKIGLEE